MAKKRKGSSGINWTWVIGGLALLGAGYYWLKQQLALIQLAGITIPFQKLEGTQIRLTIRVSIVNASSISANVTGFTGYLLNPDGSVISTVFLIKPVQIPKYGQADLDFASIIGAGAIVSELYQILSSGQQPDWKGYKLKGTLRVYGFPIPVETALV